MKTNIKLIVIGICLIFMMGLVSSVEQTLPSVEQNECIELKQTCASCTYNNISVVSYQGGLELLTEVEMNNPYNTYFNYSFCNTSRLGTYIVSGYGDYNGEIKTWVYNFNVGKELTSEQTAIYIISLITLVIFLLISIIGIVMIENPIGKFVCYWISHVLLVVGTFSAWQLNENYVLFAGFGGVFKVIFYFSIIAMFPMMIMSIAGIIIYFATDKKVQNLINKGMPEAEAWKRQGRKYK